MNSLFRRTILFALPLLAVLPACAGSPAREPLVVLLVRHAEKVDSSRDPELSAAGDARAMQLAASLRDSRLDRIYSSDFIRTRNTAAPIAALLELQVDLYDPDDLPALVERMRRHGGRILVVGHSNTTPQVVELLGGEPGPPIDDAVEYDRLYVVTVGPDGAVSTLLLRYGESSETR